MLAVACYVPSPGDEVFRPLTIDVLRIAAVKVAEITAFSLERLTQALGIPQVLT